MITTECSVKKSISVPEFFSDQIINPNCYKINYEEAWDLRMARLGVDIERLNGEFLEYCQAQSFNDNLPTPPELETIKQMTQSCIDSSTTSSTGPSHKNNNSNNIIRMTSSAIADSVIANNPIYSFMQYGSNNISPQHHYPHPFPHHHDQMSTSVPESNKKCLMMDYANTNRHSFIGNYSNYEHQQSQQQTQSHITGSNSKGLIHNNSIYGYASTSPSSPSANNMNRTIVIDRDQTPTNNNTSSCNNNNNNNNSTSSSINNTAFKLQQLPDSTTAHHKSQQQQQQALVKSQQLQQQQQNHHHNHSHHHQQQHHSHHHQHNHRQRHLTQVISINSSSDNNNNDFSSTTLPLYGFNRQVSAPAGTYSNNNIYTTAANTNNSNNNRRYFIGESFNTNADNSIQAQLTQNSNWSNSVSSSNRKSLKVSIPSHHQQQQQKHHLYDIATSPGGGPIGRSKHDSGSESSNYIKHLKGQEIAHNFIKQSPRPEWHPQRSMGGVGAPVISSQPFPHTAPMAIPISLMVPEYGSTMDRSYYHLGNTQCCDSRRLDMIADTNRPLEEHLWYHPNLSRTAAENLLSKYPEGSFLVRPSQSAKLTDEYSLSIRYKQKWLHMKINRDIDGQFVLGQYSQPYPSIPIMIRHYSCSFLPVKGANLISLTQPIFRQ